MKCIECGHELKDGAIFCIRCGAMQVSMDGKPIERGEDWPTLDAADGAGFRSSTDGALHSAQSKNPRGFQPAPNRGGGGKIAILIIVLIAAIALIAFAVVQCNSSATSGSSSAASTVASTSDSSASDSSTSSSSSSGSSASSASSTSASSASTSASSASASAASASASAAATQNQQPQQQAQPEPQPEPVYNDYYVLPSSSTYYYSYGELSGMSTYDLFIARNEVFARHGRMFNRSDLQDYFNSQAWYNPIYTPAQWDSMGNQLNDCEMKNVALMKQVEADKGSPYL